MTDWRIVELLEFAAAEGIDLPMPAEQIAAIEEAGGLVDLVTGEVYADGASWAVEPTVIGEATAVVLSEETRDKAP